MRTPSPLRATAALATLALAAALPVTAAPAQAAEGDTTTINLVGITDLHGHIDRVEKDGKVSEPGAVTLACEVAAARSADASTLFVSNGDNVGGSAYVSSILDDEPTIDILNAMGLDVTSTGNHEFDKGIDDLSGRLLDEFDAPILSANVTGNDALTAEGDGNGTWVKDVNGVKVGFVGVVTDELPTLVSGAALSGLTVENAVATANARATELKESGKADVVVVLAHEDADIYGKEFNGDVDAVFGGHTHVPYAETITGTEGNTIAVVQADHYGLALGEISLTVTEGADGEKAVTAQTAANKDLTTSDCTTDAFGVQALVEKADADAEAAGSEVLATLGSDFYRGTNTGATDSTDSGSNRSTESTASDLIADSFQSWVAKDIKPAGDHYIGLMNPGGVRADYAEGDLTEGEAYTVQPFGNEIGYATYTGAQIRQVLAEQFQPTTTRSALMLGVSSNVAVYLNQDAADELEDYFTQISTGAVTADSLADKIADARSRVIEAVYVDGEALADDDSVVAASNSFLLGGGDGFKSLGTSTMVNTGILDRDITAEYLKALDDAGTPATASYDKRQIGVDLDVDQDSGKATVRLTGLSFTPTSEQATGNAAKTVTATVTMADGSTKELTTADVDRTVISGMPETGQAAFDVELPDGVKTEACSFDSTRQCAVVSFTVTNEDGSTEVLDVTAEITHDAAATPTAEPTDEATQEHTDAATQAPSSTAGVSSTSTPAAERVATAPASHRTDSLAHTGASIGIGVIALALLGLGGVLVARRRSSES